MASATGGASSRAKSPTASWTASRILALKPLTFMNDSGRSVGEAMRFYGVEPADLYAFHDELDLAAGKVRVKRGGGTAGHNGLRSLGRSHRRRLLPRAHRHRPSGRKGTRVHGHVLGDFAKADARGSIRSSTQSANMRRCSPGMSTGGSRTRSISRSIRSTRSEPGGCGTTPDGIQVRHHRASQRRQIDAVQRPDPDRRSPGGELSRFPRSSPTSATSASPTNAWRHWPGSRNRSRSCRRG